MRDIEAGFALVVPFVWVFGESLLLSTWGTTPGKWLLKTTLRDSSAQKLTFSKALNRSFSVWWRGMGIGFPIATLITLIVAYNRLTKDGTTTWDRDGGFTVLHQRIGATRVVVTILFMVGVIWLAMLERASRL